MFWYRETGPDVNVTKDELVDIVGEALSSDKSKFKRRIIYNKTKPERGSLPPVKLRVPGFGGGGIKVKKMRNATLLDSITARRRAIFASM